jgi:hypothetical protein
MPSVIAIPSHRPKPVQTLPRAFSRSQEIASYQVEGMSLPG